MKKENLSAWIKEMVVNHEGNRLTEEQAGDSGLAGLQLYEEPLVGFASAADCLFEDYKKPEIVGPWYKGPGEWLPGAKTVISIFFPFSAEIRESNRKDAVEPSMEWLFGRIEGQAFLNDAMKAIGEYVSAEEIGVCIPSLDSRFCSNAGGDGIEGYEAVSKGVFASNWSELHTAFACGLGTFGLSKGIITEKGMAGRLGSLIIDLEMEPDVRPYTEVYEYCSKCGACIKRCPGDAISLEEGKKHVPCNKWLVGTKERYAPRYGCGKCQVKVPCENRIPVKRA